MQRMRGVSNNKSCFSLYSTIIEIQNWVCGYPIICDACLITLDNFPLFTAERKLNQETILKDITDSTSDRYTAVKISCLTLKSFSLLKRDTRCWAFLWTLFTCCVKDKFLSISVPKYVKASTCSTTCPPNLSGSERGCSELDGRSLPQHSYLVLFIFNSSELSWNHSINKLPICNQGLLISHVSH